MPDIRDSHASAPSVQQPAAEPAAPPRSAIFGPLGWLLVAAAAGQAVVSALSSAGAPRLLLAVAAVAACLGMIVVLVLHRVSTALPSAWVPGRLAAAGLLGATSLLGCLAVATTGRPATGWLVPLAIVAAGTQITHRRTTLALAGASLAATALATVIGLLHETPGSVAAAQPWFLLVVGCAVAAELARGAVAERDRAATALAKAGEAADALAMRDSLTGAANRRGLDMIAAPIIEHSRRQGEAVHCLFIDIDGFKTINEALGHGRGDEVLTQITQVLADATRSTDVIARWSGDQFVVVGPGTGTSPLEMERRLRARLTAHPPVPPKVWTPRASVGSATLVPWDEGDLDSLLRRAEQDMHLRRSLRRQSALSRRQQAASPSPQEPVSDPGD